MKLCETCPDYPTCKEPCPEVEAYISQDEVKRSPNEVLFSELGIENDIDQKYDYPEPAYDFSVEDWVYLVKKYNPTATQKRFLYHYYWLNMSYQDIASKYNTSRQNVYYIINYFKKYKKIE